MSIRLPGLAWAGLALALTLLPTAPGHAAASVDRSRKVVLMVYDVGLYGAELEQAMAQGDKSGIYPGETIGSRARNRATVRTLMLGERSAVLDAATAEVAVQATDPQLDALLQAAASPSPVAVSPLIEDAVTVVKSSFQDALWNQLTRVARGVGEFPCTREQRSRCS